MARARVRVRVRGTGRVRVRLGFVSREGSPCMKPVGSAESSAKSARKRFSRAWAKAAMRRQ